MSSGIHEIKDFELSLTLNTAEGTIETANSILSTRVKAPNPQGYIFMPTSHNTIKQRIEVWFSQAISKCARH